MCSPDTGKYVRGYRFLFNGKESDSEWHGTSGSIYDYGFRIYNPRIGKFLSVDPLTKHNPYNTPYLYANSSPLTQIDEDGKSGVVYKTNRKNAEGKPILLVVSVVYLYGEYADNDACNAVYNDIDLQYNNNGDFFNASIDGVDYEIQFEITVLTIEESEVEQKLIEGNYHDLNAENNFFEVRNDVETSFMFTGISGGNTGVLKKEQIYDNSHSVSHEMNHGYDGINRDKETTQVDNKPDIAVTRGNTNNPSSRQVTQDNIDAIFKDINLKNSNYSKIGVARPQIYDKNSPYKSKTIRND